MQTLKKLVPTLALRHRMTQKEMDAIVSDIQDHIAASLANGDTFVLADIGRLIPKARKARTGRNPQTGKEIAIPARLQVQFKTSSVLLDAMNKK